MQVWLRKAVPLLVFTAFFSSGFASFEKDLNKALKKGDWYGTADLLETFYDRLGASIHDSLYWHQESSLETVNYYNQKVDRPLIGVSAFPDKKNIWLYWENWSKALTQGAWKPRNFFTSTNDALALARYNILMLMSHELGHHIAHRHKKTRYMGDDPETGGTPLNCHEYYADMASVALTVSFKHGGKLDKRNLRYIDLLMNINQFVPEQLRYNEFGFNLHQHCDSLVVDYPSEDKMGPYASAYFVRRKYLEANPGFSTPEAIMNALFLDEEIALRSAYGEGYEAIETIYDGDNRQEYNSETRNQRAIATLFKWGRTTFETFDEFAFSKNQGPVQVHCDYPTIRHNGTGLVFTVRNIEGNLLNRWTYTSDAVDTISYAELLGVKLRQPEKDFCALVLQKPMNDSWGEPNLILYKHAKGFDLQRIDLNLPVQQNPLVPTRINLLWVNSSEVGLVVRGTDTKDLITVNLIRVSLDTKMSDTTLLFTFPNEEYHLPPFMNERYQPPTKINNMASSYWSVDSIGENQLLFASPHMIMTLENGELRRIYGSGFEGENYGRGDCNVIRAVKWNTNGSVEFVDELVGLSWQERKLRWHRVRKHH
ncbi:MAG: hypothetical protein JJ975_05555 [Bacteroidia bacterium]|nr:hypothetical protein [Bacteroidia bacterium]